MLHEHAIPSRKSLYKTEIGFDLHRANLLVDHDLVPQASGSAPPTFRPQLDLLELLLTDLKTFFIVTLTNNISTFFTISKNMWVRGWMRYMVCNHDGNMQLGTKLFWNEKIKYWPTVKDPLLFVWATESDKIERSVWNTAPWCYTTRLMQLGLFLVFVCYLHGLSRSTLFLFHLLV